MGSVKYEDNYIKFIKIIESDIFESVITYLKVKYNFRDAFSAKAEIMEVFDLEADETGIIVEYSIFMGWMNSMFTFQSASGKVTLKHNPTFDSEIHPHFFIIFENYKDAIQNNSVIQKQKKRQKKTN